MADSKLETTVYFTSRFDAFMASMEALGSHQMVIPVMLPAFVPQDVLSAAIRSGAVPALMDVDPETFAIDPKVIDAYLTEYKDETPPIIVSCLGPGMTPCPVLDKYLEEKELVHILVHEAPSSDVSNCPDYALQIYGQSLPVHLRMGVVSTVFEDLIDALHKIQHSPLGTYNSLSDSEDRYLREYYDELTVTPEDSFAMASAYADKHGWKVVSMHPGYGGGTTIYVPDGFIRPDQIEEAQEHVRPLFEPTYKHVEVQERFAAGVPEYPGVDEVTCRLFCIDDDYQFLKDVTRG